MTLADGLAVATIGLILLGILSKITMNRINAIDKRTIAAEGKADAVALSISEQKAQFLQIFVLKGDYQEMIKTIERHLDRIEKKIDSLRSSGAGG